MGSSQRNVIYHSHLPVFSIVIAVLVRLKFLYQYFSLLTSIGDAFSLEAIDKKIHNLRTSMRRLVKKELEAEVEENPTDSSQAKTPKKQWKFYDAMLFLKMDIEHDLEKEKNDREMEMSDEEKVTLVEFYKNSPHLWDTSLQEYRDRDRKRVSLDKLVKEFDEKYNRKQLTDTWHKMTTKYHSESSKQESSMKSGAGKEEVYTSDWPFFSSMEFLKDKTEPDTGVSTTFDHMAPLEKKKNPKRKQEEEKENAIELAKVRVLEALVTRLGDKGTTGNEMTWKNGFEAGFQAGLQQGLMLSQIQLTQPKPVGHFMFPHAQLPNSYTGTSTINHADIQWSTDSSL